MGIAAARILFEDDWLIAVDKLPGELVIGDRWKREARDNVLLYALGEYLRAQGHKADESGRDLYPVHRLDRETSGIVLFAKHQEAHRELSLLFEGREVKKKYLALAVESPDWNFALCKAPLARAEGKKGRGRALVDFREGKPAETEFSVKERYGDLTLFEAAPLTGRLHQIRIHARALGCPLYLDPDYGLSDWKSEVHKKIPLKAMLLHAAEISFRHPGKKQALKITSPLPQAARETLDKLFEAGEQLA